MIVTKMQGRNGNQMFIFAAAYALAKRTNQRLFCDVTTYYAIEPHLPGETFVLDYFPNIAPLLDAVLARAVRSEAAHLLARYFSEECFHIYENGNDFTGQLNSMTPASLSASRISNIFLHGNFQNEGYFKDAEDDLRKIFAYPNPTSERTKKFLSLIREQENPVSVTVRRGDYVTNPAAAKLLGGMCPPEYYHRAFEIVRAQVKNPTFVFFSDDMDWVKRNFPLPENSILADANHEANSTFSDMFLTSQCRHNILANSTYCWWGAWLDNRPDKLVIAPPKWFNLSEYATLDAGIVPDRWARITF